MKMIIMILVGIIAAHFAYSIIPSGCEPIEICDESGCRTYEYDYDGVGCSVAVGESIDPGDTREIGYEFLDDNKVVILNVFVIYSINVQLQISPLLSFYF